MDTLGPRIMVNVGTQAVTNTGLNPRDLAPLTNDAFLATFMGKPALSTTNGISRQHNNQHQSYTTQMERLTLRSKERSSAANGESIEPDSAILSVIRGNGLENNQQQTSQQQSQSNRNYHRSFHQQKYFSGWNDKPCSPNYRPTNDSNRQRRTRSGGMQQQITVVDQMAAQPHIPYAILPKRFEPKQLSANGLPQQSRSSNSNVNHRRRPATMASRRQQRQQPYYDDQWEDVEDDDGWNELSNRRRGNRRQNQNFGQTNAYRGPRQNFNDYSNSYSYGKINRYEKVPIRSNRRMIYQNDGYIPFNIVPSYDLNQWQGPYARSRQSFNSQYQRGGFRLSYGGRNDDGFIHDDHRLTNSSKQSRHRTKPTTVTRHSKQTKPVKSKGPPKRRNSQQHKKRNQNSKSEGSTSSTTANEVKSTTETTEENKTKEESTTIVTATETKEQPLPPRNNEAKETEVEQPSE